MPPPPARCTRPLMNRLINKIEVKTSEASLRGERSEGEGDWARSCSALPPWGERTREHPPYSPWRSLGVFLLSSYPSFSCLLFSFFFLLFSFSLFLLSPSFLLFSFFSLSFLPFPPFLTFLLLSLLFFFSLPPFFFLLSPFSPSTFSPPFLPLFSSFSSSFVLLFSFLSPLFPFFSPSFLPLSPFFSLSFLLLYPFPFSPSPFLPSRTSRRTVAAAGFSLSPPAQ